MTTDTASIHRRTWDQIPWIVNGTLPESDLPSASQHLQECSDCREELAFQQHIAQSLVGRQPAHVDPQRSWQQLRSRIEASDGTDRQDSTVDVAGTVRASVGGAAAAAAHSHWTGWLVAAVVVQAVGLGVLGSNLWSHQIASPASSSGAVYQTLSAAEPAVLPAATIRVVFAGDMQVGRMQALLDQAGLQVVSGPSSAGVWSLGPTGDSSRMATQSALVQLRANGDVHFAEAVGGSH
ncbi:MAG TPA: hypothetical protein VHZ99_05890 [Steroidobacteraceae bacterium]|jgi:hypothetical protein|nr:hypothetical protein [Steroidobacteraceae bacterium]